MAKSTTSTTSTTSTIKNIFTNLPWKWIFIGIIILFVILTLVKFFAAIGAVEDSFKKVLGSAANAAADFVTSCTPQADCTTLTLCDTCNNTSGCGCGSNNTCQITSGRPVGGVNWIFCGVFLGFIIAGMLILLVALAKSLGVWKASPAVEDMAKTTNQDPKKIAEVLAKESKADLKEALKDIEKPSKELKDIIAEKIASTNLLDRTYKDIEKVPALDKKGYLDNAKNTFDNTEKNRQIEVDKLSSDDKKIYDDKAKDYPEPERPKI